MRLAAPVAVVAAALAVHPALAPADPDDAEAVVSDGKARPVRVKVALRGAIATLHVTALLDHDGPGEREFTVALPPRGMVTAASVRIGHATHALALTPAEDANTTLADLESAPVAGTSASAIAIEQPDFGDLAVTTLLPRRAALVLELDIEAGTCFVGDHRHLQLPGEWADLLDGGSGKVLHDEAAARVDARCTDDAGWSDDGDGLAWLELKTTELSSRPVGDDRLGARGGRFAHGAVQAARVELALASTISAVPDDLATAFVVDGSRSIDSEDQVAQAEVIASYLAHAPDTVVQVIAFDRAAHPLLKKWTRAGTAARPIAKALARLALRNGSDLDVGLAEAGRWLADHDGARRVVVFTDELYSDRLAALDPATLATLVPPGTVVHVVAIDPGDGSVVRDDTLAFAPLADATLGMPVRAGGGTDITVDALALVRPISLDHVRVIAPGFDPLASTGVTGTTCVDARSPTDPIALAEGEACTWWATGPTTLDAITVEGLLWGRRWRREVALGDRESVDVARELWSVVDRRSTPELAELADAADVAARAVNPRWSLFATWGGTGGYPDLFGIGRSGSGCGCGGSSSDIGVGRFGTLGVVGGRSVEDQVKTAIAACHAAGDGATIGIELEATRSEIVGIDTTITGVTGAVATTMRACVDTAVWDLELWVAQPREHQRWTLAY